MPAEPRLGRSTAQAGGGVGLAGGAAFRSPRFRRHTPPMIPAFCSRSGADRRGQRCRPGAAQFGRPGAPRRGARLPALLDGRAPQHARHRQRGDRGRARPCRGGTSASVGAGGIMLPNHAPLMIAEQFGTLAALHPGRVDLGLGRAPGTDQVAARAMRRNLDGDVRRLPARCRRADELFRAGSSRASRCRRCPVRGSRCRSGSWGPAPMARSSPPMLGLPFAFASHFAPAMMMEAMAIYRQRFRPSAQLAAALCDARVSTSRRGDRR